MKSFLLLLCLWLSSIVVAQQTVAINQTTNGGDIHKQQHHERLLSVAQTLDVFEGKCTFIAEINLPYNSESTQILSRQGLVLRDYFYTGWLAEFEGTPEKLAAVQGLNKIKRIAPEQKISPDLLHGEIPLHARVGDRIALDISVFKGFEYKQVVIALNKINCRVIRRDISGEWLVIHCHPSKISEIAAFPFVVYVSTILPEGTPENYNARAGHRIGCVQGNGFDYDGTDVHVMLQDDGPIGPHIDFSGRIGASYPSVNRGDHGDHVAGTILGAGNRNPKARGMAPGAKVFIYGAASEDYPGFDSIYSHYSQHSIAITSTSYSNGCNAGYTALSRKLDQQVNQFPLLLHVFSAGNSGNLDCSYGRPAYGNITGGHKVAKNTLVVANLSATDTLNVSSSRGPAKDGRLKPDISAIGTSVYSTVENQGYDTKTGTSMSCPGVSGTAATLQHAFRDLTGFRPAAALLRNILLNAADDMGNPGPDYQFGFGRINARKSLGIIRNNQFDSAVLSTGDTARFSIVIPPGVSEVRAMLTWDDPAATAGSIKPLINDLDIDVIHPQGGVIRPLVLNPAPASVHLNAIPGRDAINNAEQVVILGLAPGTAEIRIHGFAVPAGSQKAFLTWMFEYENPVVTYPNGNERLAPNETEFIRWDSPDRLAQTTVSYSPDSGNTWTPIATVPSGTRFCEWKVPNALTGKARIRVSMNGRTDDSDENFSILGVPGSTFITKACTDSLILSWPLISGADRYTIYELGAMYMDSIATSPANSLTIKAGYHPMEDAWYAVSAHSDVNGIDGRRSPAVRKTPGLYNCILDYDLKLVRFDNDASLQMQCHPNSNMLIAIEVENTGLQTISQFLVQSTFEGGPIYTDTIRRSVAGYGLEVIYLKNTPPISLSPGRLKVWVNLDADQFLYNDTLSILVKPSANPPITSPYVETFDNLSKCAVTTDCEITQCNLGNGWTNVLSGSGDDIDWRTHYGMTASNGTGPTGDHTSGQGHYIYLEATNCFAKGAFLRSPCIDLRRTIQPTLRFWYHMYGSDMGELRMDVFSDSVWLNDIITPLVGINLNQWQEYVFDLSAFKGRIINLRFRGKTGSDYRSDIALDDISVLFETDYNSTTESDNTSALFVYPNPVAERLHIYGLDVGEKVKFQLSDASGRQIRNFESTGSNINLSNIVSGVYLLRVLRADGSIAHFKMVKQE